MILNYTPEGASERNWTFIPDKLLSSEAEVIEKVTGMTYAEFGQALIKGSASARRALLWVLLKREDPPLRHNQVDPAVGTIGLDYESHELKAIRDEVQKSRDISDEERDAALAELDALIEDEVDVAPKATEKDDDSSD